MEFGYVEKQQLCSIRSNAEAEYKSMVQGVCELMWLKILMKDLKLLRDNPIRLYCDNEAAIDIAH